MSTWSGIDWLSIACPRCGAAVGQPCVTRNGLRASLEHTARQSPLWDAWNAGCWLGVDDVLSALDSTADTSGYLDSLRRDLARFKAERS
jgi:hypothetical protein